MVKNGVFFGRWFFIDFFFNECILSKYIDF